MCVVIELGVMPVRSRVVCGEVMPTRHIPLLPPEVLSHRTFLGFGSVAYYQPC